MSLTGAGSGVAPCHGFMVTQKPLWSPHCRISPVWLSRTTITCSSSASFAAAESREFVGPFIWCHSRPASKVPMPAYRPALLGPADDAAGSWLQAESRQAVIARQHRDINPSAALRQPRLTITYSLGEP